MSTISNPPPKSSGGVSAARFLPSVLLAVLFAGLLTLPAFAADTPPPAEPPAEAERSPTGLASVVLEPGDGESPDENDFVAIHYTGWTPAGARFESSHDKGQPAIFSLERIFPGWHEGILQMSVGEKRRLWVPASLTPPKPQSGPQGDVIFDLELLAVKKIPEMPGTKPPEGATMTRFGAFSRILEEGEGEETGAAGRGALTHYIVWAGDGKVHDTSLIRERPTLFVYENMLPAFSDVLKQMKVGERRQIWIPENVANGNWVGKPKGMLIFDVEMIRIADDELLGPKGGPPTGGR